MKITGSAACFPVRNVDASLRFFIDVLGFKQAFRFGEYAGIERDECLIHLSLESNPNTSTPGSGCLYVFCDEVDRYYEELVSRGADVLEAPRDYPYGMRDFVIQDPDGNRITFGCSISQK